jgi:hypothetical protein
MTTPMVGPMMPTIVVVVGSVQERNSDQSVESGSDKSCAARRPNFGLLTAQSGPEARPVHRVINFHTKSYQSSNDRCWRKAVIEVWMLDLAGSRWLDLVQTSSGWTGPTSIVVPPRVMRRRSCVIQDRLPTIEARRDSSIQLPSGSRIMDIRATLPSVTGARPSRTPLLRRSLWTVSISAICKVM